MHRISKRQPAWIANLTVLLLAAFSSALAETPAETPTEAQSGRLLWQMQQGYATATLLNTEVNLQISGLLARVSVRQEFHNDGPDWVEGIYVFPLPDGAAVNRMRLHIGERFIEADVKEKEDAKTIYNAAKQAGKKASLVEQQRANLFTTSVANVAPGERVVVEIEYLEDLRYEDGRFSLRFPMTLTPRYIPGQGLPDKQGNGWSADTDRVPDASLVTPPMVTASRAHKIALTASIDAGMPLDIVTSRYHPVNVTEQDGRYAVKLDSGTVPMDHDFELVWQPTPSAKPRAMAFTETIGGKPYHLLMVMPPDEELASAALMPREVVFIIDTSGSMHGVSITQAKRALTLALEGLQPQDLFNVIEFNSSTDVLHRQSVAASSTNVTNALAFVSQLEANGGTEMRPALAAALRMPSHETHLRQIIFITDGSVGYEDEMFSMIEGQLGNARLFTVGIGSAPNSWFMRKAAEAGRGTFTFISALHEVQEKMNGLFGKLKHPQVTGIDVQWPSGVAVDSYPATVPDLYLGEPVVIKARASGAYRNSGSANGGSANGGSADGDTVRISGNSTSGGWSTDLSLTNTHQSPGIGALWARAKIAGLMDQERRGGSAEVRGAIVDTAIEHHLVSKYTSLVAVDKTPVRPVADPLSSEQVPNLMAYGQSTNKIFGFPATATSAPLLRVTGILWLLAALLLFAALQAHPQWRHVRAR